MSDISVTLSGKPVTITNVMPSANNKSYTINGTFEFGSKYKIAIAKPNYTFNTIEASEVPILPAQSHVNHFE